jgi:excisionase family DNA binding protein
MATTMNKRLLDVKAAAQYLSIGRSKLYEWAKSGRIKSVRIDSRRLFDVQDLDSFVEQLKQQTN